MTTSGDAKSGQTYLSILQFLLQLKIKVHYSKSEQHPLIAASFGIVVEYFACPLFCRWHQGVG
jgi:hypothetical protein